MATLHRRTVRVPTLTDSGGSPLVPSALREGTNKVEYTYSDLGNLPASAMVRVTIQGDGPNVRIFDSSNFRSFTAGGQAKFYGGHAKRSPVTIPVPYAGHWYLVIDFGGYAGRANFSYEVLSVAV